MDIVLAPVVQTLYRAIQRINHYPAEKYWETNCTIHWIENYPPDKCYHGTFCITEAYMVPKLSNLTLFLTSLIQTLDFVPLVSVIKRFDSL